MRRMGRERDTAARRAAAAPARWAGAYSPQPNSEALSRCAWILTMVDGDHSEALALSERASRYAPVDTDVRTVRALVLARSSAPAEALPVFGSVPADARTPESFAYEALAWLANSLAARDKHLRAGEVVMLGSVVETHWVMPNDEVQIDIEGVGGALVKFV